MGSRGRAFAQAAYRNFGPVQLEDQLTVIDAALEKYPQLDPKRLGWWGWSWGGTFTLYAMTHSDRFRAGVAVAPVTDWRNYDSIYTERYLGLPAEDQRGLSRLFRGELGRAPEGTAAARARNRRRQCALRKYGAVCAEAD